MESKDYDLWDGLFDLDGDGETDLTEEFLAYEVIEELTKDEDDPDIALYEPDTDDETDDEYS